MDKDVTVTVTGLHNADDGKDFITTSNPGTYYKKNSKHYIFFEETTEDKDVIKSAIRIDGEKISLTKKGAINTVMIFEKDKVNKTIYNMPYGAVVMDVNTREVVIVEEEDGMLIDISYSLGMNEMAGMDCNIRIKVQKNN